jgi:hypothetical protein
MLGEQKGGEGESRLQFTADGRVVVVVAVVIGWQTRVGTGETWWASGRGDMLGVECWCESGLVVLACSSSQPRLDGKAKEARRHITHVLPNMLPSDLPRLVA